MKILISAAEASSDIHGAALLRAIREEVAARAGDLGHAAGAREVSAFGIGGPGLQAEGLRAVVDARGLLSMGFLEIFWKIPRFLRSLRLVAKAASVEKPDVAVVIDYPDFHFRLARRLKRLGIPVVYYIPPKVWVWRRSRVRLLRERFVRVLSIFPFEADFLKAESVPVVYVGNPLVDELPLELTRIDARRELGIPADARVLALLPGSRPAELKHHLARMLDAARIAASALKQQGWLAEGQALRVLIPLSAATDSEPVHRGVRDWLARAGGAGKTPLEISVSSSPRASALALLAADAGVVKSGTSTLEAGALLCPHVVVYRPNAISSWIFHTFIRYPGPIGLVNLVGGFFGRLRCDCPVPELICEEVTPPAIAERLVPLFAPGFRRDEMLAYLELVRSRLIGDQGRAGTSPSRAAAREVLGVASRGAGVAGVAIGEAARGAAGGAVAGTSTSGEAEGGAPK